MNKLRAPFVALAIALAGCNCGGPKVGACTSTNPCCMDGKLVKGCVACMKDGDCPNGDYCDPGTKTCQVQARSCGDTTDAGFGPTDQTNPCCPGQTCSDTLQQCADTYTQCTTDADCFVPGQYCNQTLGFYPQGPGCTFHTCTTQADCALGTQCFNSYCVGQPPCGGGCPAGGVCTPASNQCYTLGMNASSSCMQTCAAGSMLVFADGTNVWDHCNHAETNTCQCAALPNIQSNDTARFSSATVTSSSVLVSAYDTDHGDLVLHTFDKVSLNEAPGSPEWIDGVPTTGTITGNPAGPRGGRAAAGPDVGKYTSIAYDPSGPTTHIAYYGVSDGNTPPMALTDLRYARRTGTGAWTIITIDGADSASMDGDVGRYASITLAPDGSPVIAYFQAAGTGANTATTALLVARAKNNAPMSASDWLISTVDTGTRALPPCGGAMCAANQACIPTQSNTNGACTATTTGCTPACSSGSACTMVGGAPACSATVPALPLGELPDGNGLMPSIAYMDSLPVVVWYDHTNGQLKGIIATSDASQTQGIVFNSANIKVLDDGTAPNRMTAHDVGRFPSLAIGPSSGSQRIAVAYMDATARQTLMFTAKSDWSNITALGSRVMDAGVHVGSSADLSVFSGANTSLRYVGNALALAYQDSTGNAVRLINPADPAIPGAPQVLAQTGAGGFYASMVVDGNEIYISNAIIAAANQNTSANQLKVLRTP